MTRYVVRITVDCKPKRIIHRRDVVTTKTKEAVRSYFRSLYSKHIDSGNSVTITFLEVLPCGDLFEVLSGS